MQASSLKRKFVSRGANFLADTMHNPGVSDLTGSFRLYEFSVLRNIITLTISRGYVFQMEMMVRAHSLRYMVGRVPIIFGDHLFGKSNLDAGEVQYGKGVRTLFTTMWTNTHHTLLYNHRYRPFIFSRENVTSGHWSWRLLSCYENHSILGTGSWGIVTTLSK